MQIVLCIVSVLFGGLSLIAAISQIKSERKSPAVLMMIGSLLLIAAAVGQLAGEQWNVIPAFLGCAAICAAAILNGIKSKQFHIQHHVIRIALSIVLVVGFAAL